MAQTNEAGERGPAAVSRLRVLGFALKPLLMLAVLLLLPFAMQVAGFIKLQALGSWVELRRADSAGASALARAAALLPKAEAGAGDSTLAAEATQEGHWRFVNRTGETLTAGTTDEMQRVVSILLPDAKPETPLTVLVTLETLLERRDALKDLPKRAIVRVAAGGESYAVLNRPQSTSAPFIEVRPNIVVEAGDGAAVREALWQLSRPLDRASIRVLALEPGGPSTLTALPRTESPGGRAMVDVIDPTSLAAAMGSVRGQTLIITGRIEAGVLYVQPSRGSERGVLVGDLFAAADQADVNLVILESASTPRQPGGRNWFWQRVEVKGLAKGLARPRLADLLDAVGGASARFVAVARSESSQRTRLELTAAPSLPRSGAAAPSLGDLLLDTIGDVTGRVVTSTVQANLLSVARQREMDRRVVPFLPSAMQAGYVLLVLLGLAGLPVARGWWARIWPPENAAEYSSMVGYQAACFIRAALLYAVFLPLASVAAAPQALARWLGLAFRRSPSAKLQPHEAGGGA